MWAQRFLLPSSSVLSLPNIRILKEQFSIYINFMNSMKWQFNTVSVSFPSIFSNWLNFQCFNFVSLFKIKLICWGKIILTYFNLLKPLFFKSETWLPWEAQIRVVEQIFRSFRNGKVDRLKYQFYMALGAFVVNFMVNTIPNLQVLV